MATGWQQVSGTWYLLGPSGAMRTGWQLVGGTWYWMESWGGMVTGWKKIDGAWYLFGPWGGMATGWQKVGETWYWMDENGAGAMATGWRYIGGAWRLLASSGAMLVGWQQVDGAWYWMDENGAMATGWRTSAARGGCWPPPAPCSSAGSRWTAPGTGWTWRTAPWPRAGATSAARGGCWPPPAPCSSAGSRWTAPGTGWTRTAPWPRAGATSAARGGCWPPPVPCSSAGSRWTAPGTGWTRTAPWPRASGRSTARSVPSSSGVCLNPPANPSEEPLPGSSPADRPEERLLTVMGPAQATASQMVAAYARTGAAYPSSELAKGGAPTIDDFCRIVIEEASAEGVRPELVYCQIMNETGNLRFGGDVKIEQFNFCGLGATGGGVPGNSFKDVRTGIRAQVQHLKCYASREPLNQPKVDPRWWDALRGTAVYVQHLGIQENPNTIWREDGTIEWGRGWATAKNYGYNLAKNMKLYFGVE